MTNKKYLIAGVVASMSMCMSSCISKSYIVRADDYDGETIVDIMNEESPSIVIDKDKPHAPSFTRSKEHYESTPINGQWTIIAVGNDEIHTDDEMPYIVFTDNDRRFYASNGCNYINGTYKCDGTIVSFSSTLTTLALCPEEYSDKISGILKDGISVRYQLENKGNETYMYLLSQTGSKLMTLRAHNMNILNGQWIVSSIDGEKVDNPELNIYMDIPQGTVHGNTGCNFFNGEITIDPFTASAISFSGMSVTMRMCPNADLERKMLVALESTSNYKLKDNNNTLVLTDRRGKEEITLSR